MSTLSARMDHARQRMGLSQTEIARRIGVSQQAVAKWIAGESSPQPARLVALAEALAVPPEWLMFGKGPAPDALAEQLYGPTPDAREQLRSACVELSALSAQVSDLMRRQRVARVEVESQVIDSITRGAQAFGWDAMPADRRAELVLARDQDFVRVDVSASVLHPPATGAGDLLVHVQRPLPLERSDRQWFAWPILIGDQDEARVLVLPATLLRGAHVVLSWLTPERLVVRAGDASIDISQHLDRFDFESA